MSNKDITRLIVGEPFTLHLGASVSQSGIRSDAPEGSTLRWVDGRWESSAKSLEDRLRSIKMPTATSIKLRAGRPSWLRIPTAPVARFAAEVAIVFLIGVPVAIYFAKSGLEPHPTTTPATTQELPLEARQPAPSGVIREVDRSYAPETDQAPVADPQADSTPPSDLAQLPINSPGQPARIVIPAIPARAAPQSASNKPSSQARAPLEDHKAQPGSGAVILDEDVARAPARQQTPVPAPTVASVARPSATPDPKKDVPQGPPRLALVAVTPDGKTALFTDPKTRLPVQYKVGQKLSTGETIKVIDGKSGKVTTDKQTYVLE